MNRGIGRLAGRRAAFDFAPIAGRRDIRLLLMDSTWAGAGKLRLP